MKWKRLFLRGIVTALTTLFLTTISLQVVHAATQTIQNGGTGWSNWGGTWYTQPSGGQIGGYHYTFNVTTTAEAGATWASSGVSAGCEVYAYVPPHSPGYRTTNAEYSTTSPVRFRSVNQDQYPTMIAYGLIFSSSCSNPSVILDDSTGETYGTKYVVFDDVVFID